MEDHRAGDYHDSTDNCDLEEGMGDMGFDLNDYEGAEELPSLPSTTASLLPPHVKAAWIMYHYEQQEQRCYTCDETRHFSHNCPVQLQALKDKKGLNLKGALSAGVWKPPKAAQKGCRRCPSHTVRCTAMCICLENLMPMLNKDAKSHWLERDNIGYAMIEGNPMLVLLDTGANVNMITPECVVALGLQMGPLTDLQEGGITIDQSFNYEGQSYRVCYHEGAD